MNELSEEMYEALKVAESALKLGLENIEALEAENQAKSLVIVDMGCDRERLDNHLDTRITKIESQINSPDALDTNNLVTELKVYQEIKKLME